jgi:phospho-N-acetylmuramoyl-pentapeptide-transferase
VVSPGSGSQPIAVLLGAALLGACLLSDWQSRSPQLTAPLLVAALISWAVTAWGVPQLQRLKMGQVIREEGPQGHKSKAGTPTMGGLLVVPVGVLVGGLITPGDPRLLAVAAVTLAFMAIGAIDD